MKSAVLFFSILTLTSCTTAKILQYDKSDKLKKIDEYDKKMEIKELSPAEASADSRDETKSDKHKKKTKTKKRITKVESKVHQPDIEDKEGFVGRRPAVDPFRVGEKVVLNLSYFNIVAGYLAIEVKPFVEVNGEKAYHFEVSGKSNSFFSKIYAVDDKATTYVSYKDLIPINLAITLKESGQLAEARTLFDWDALKAHYWQKRVTKEHGEQEKKIDWKIKAFSQNVVSAAYYLRTFKMEVGKKLAMRVVDEGKNIVFTGEVIRRENLETALGTFKTVVIKPKIEVDGVFSPVGEILIWLTDDDRKFMVRAESAIKIGSLVAKLKELVPADAYKMPDQK